ncbi:MAG: hypothetical protein BGN86_00325 [Caulobacterales bacterium 68-7]|nr:MAG: hypothetical protein BGN86_00325 [Caulobacterales bacterium 68-7]
MRRTYIGAASVLAATLALAACATAPTSTQLADGSAKPKKAQTYDPAFQNSLDALNNPAISFTNVGPRGSGGFAR